MVADPDEGLYRIRVEGEGIQPGKVSLRDLKDLVEQIQSGVERVARVMLGEPGSAPGPLPKNLRDVTELLLVGVEPGSAVLEVELAPAKPGDAADQIFTSTPDLGFRAIDGFIDGLHELEIQDEPEVPSDWDNSVMEVAESLSRLTQERSFTVTLIGRRSPDGTQIEARVAPENVERFRVRHSPIRQPRTAVGTLIMVDLESGRVDVRPADGKRVQCLFPENLRGQIERLLGQEVQVSGEEELDVAINKRGKLEIDSLGAASEQLRLDEAFWRNPSAAELAAEQGVGPIPSIAELSSSDVTDEDVLLLLTTLRESRSEE